VERFLTTKQASIAVGLNSSRVCQLLRSGKLKGEKMGRDWLISLKELERFIEERKKR
jgi:excisionase family DNA binding protein